LSRLRSLDGLILTSTLSPGSIQLDGKISNYSKSSSEQQDLNAMLDEEIYKFINNYVSRSFDLSDLIRAMETHTDSYISKDEKRSAKQRHHNWAKELEKDLKELKSPADKFRQQINSIIHFKEENHMEFLHKRVIAATDYFGPIFKSLSGRVIRHAEIMKSEKKIKTYMSELLELESLLYEQNKLIKKAGLLIYATIEKREVSVQDIKNISKDSGREEQLIQLYSKPVNDETEEGVKVKKEKKAPKPRKERVPKAEKKDSKEESFQLYKQGNNIEEIAKVRSMAITTIEGHLAHYITKGMIDPTVFIPENKKNEIITVSKTLNTLQLGPIKQHLGEEYSYSDIRFAIAAHLATLKE
nr:helix-turn-helix domain-containing protein [Bacteroidota bacterium]